MGEWKGGWHRRRKKASCFGHWKAANGDAKCTIFRANAWSFKQVSAAFQNESPWQKLNFLLQLCSKSIYCNIDFQNVSGENLQTLFNGRLVKGRPGKEHQTIIATYIQWQTISGISLQKTITIGQYSTKLKQTVFDSQCRLWHSSITSNTLLFVSPLFMLYARSLYSGRFSGAVGVTIPSFFKEGSSPPTWRRPKATTPHLRINCQHPLIYLLSHLLSLQSLHWTALH